MDELESEMNGSADNIDTAVFTNLKRMFMFIEDSDFVNADVYAEKVLDIDPENAEAYLGKLLAELKMNKRENLSESLKLIDNSPNYQKAYNFGNEKLRDELRCASESNREQVENRTKKRKKLIVMISSISAALIIIIAISIVAGIAINISKTGGLRYELSEDGSYYIVIDAKYNLKTYEIPETWKGIEVKEIGEYAFFCSKAKKIILPNTITSIGGHAFSHCHITDISIPASVESIGRGAFKGSFLENATFEDTTSYWHIAAINATMKSGKWSYEYDDRGYHRASSNTEYNANLLSNIYVDYSWIIK